MSTENKRIGLHFGALSDPISKQLDSQGFSYTKGKVEAFQRQAEAITTLRFGDLLTDSLCDKLTQKLYKKIVSHVATANKLKPAKTQP